MINHDDWRITHLGDLDISCVILNVTGSGIHKVFWQRMLKKIFGTRNFCRMSQDVGKLNCRIAQVPLYTLSDSWITYNVNRLNRLKDISVSLKKSAMSITEIYHTNSMTVPDMWNWHCRFLVMLFIYPVVVFVCICNFVMWWWLYL